MHGMTAPFAGPGAVAFLGSWMVMMVPMMLPSLVPVLWRQTRWAGVAALVAVGYFFVWAVYGATAYVVTHGVSVVEMRWPATASLVPAATGVVLLLAGTVQLTGWKLRQLARCRDAVSCADPRSPGAASPWRQGLRLGVRCSLCCSGYMILLLVTGMMNLGVIALVAAAITVERLAPAPRLVARTAGALIIVTGAVLVIKPV